MTIIDTLWETAQQRCSNGATRESWESVDSVWGFYGEWAKEGALEHFPNPADNEQVAS